MYSTKAKNTSDRHWHGRETSSRRLTGEDAVLQPALDSTKQTAALLLAIVLAFALRLVYLGDASIWWDEGLAVWAARLSLAEMADWTARDVHPPLYFGLLHFWRQIVGDGEFAVRFLSVAVGTLAVPALWKLGRLVAPQQSWVAIGAAYLLALSRFTIWWSQEARMYMLVGLLCVLHLIFTVQLSRRFRPTAVAGYLITAVASLLTLYLTAFILVIDGIYWLLTLRNRSDWPARLRALFGWGTLQLATLAAFAPWLAYALPKTPTWSTQVPFDPIEYAQLYATLLSMGISTNFSDFALPVLLAIVTVVAGTSILASKLGSTQRQYLALLLLILILPPILVWLVTTAPRSFGYSPKPEARYLLPFAPAFYLVVAWATTGLASLAGPARQAVASALLVAFAALQVWSLGDYFSQRFLEDDYRSVAATLRAHVHTGDTVLLHTDRPWPVFAHHWPETFRGTPHLQDATPGGVDYFLAEMWEESDAIWLVVNTDSLRADPQRHFESWLAGHATNFKEWRFGLKRLVVFARTPERALALDSLAPHFIPPSLQEPIAFGGVTILGWEQSLNRLRPGDVAQGAVYATTTGSGATVAVSLGKPPLASTVVEVPDDEGISRIPVSILVPPDSAAGVHPWRVEVGAIEAIMGNARVLDHRRTDPVFDAAPQSTVGASFGDPPLIELLGYDLEPQYGAQDSLALTLYWKARGTTPTSYKVFTHLIGSDGRVVAQSDDFPMGGQRPTTSWQVSEIIIDRHLIVLDSGLLGGSYPLRIGFYDPTTGDRLGPVKNADDMEQIDDQLELQLVELSHQAR